MNYALCGTWSIWSHKPIDNIISDYIKRLPLYFQSHDQSCVYTIVQEIKSLSNVYKLSISWSKLWLEFFRRSKVKKALFSTFDLLIMLVAKTFFRRSKVIINIWSPENSSDQEIGSLIKTFELMIKKTFDLLFRSPEIRSPDPQSQIYWKNMKLIFESHS